ncbi:hypothetical protein HYH02_006672 [Chlamydomonas schloesseri]|uniref:Uncharacterized protein n=1 Tax=Chlamydomonas schloesseri TaxID=2026947 RepID=A0A835VX85_9CHLO|nr:hypothetical protein HYH02_006672 [Chlamydomonas schloesseri]|eukprot:KAG2432687.1 hypothetical protein HYH02_006672 [Chlamydomonas schloesseri]
MEVSQAAGRPTPGVDLVCRSDSSVPLPGCALDAHGNGAAHGHGHGAGHGAATALHHGGLGAAGGSEELKLESASPSTTSLQGAALWDSQERLPMGEDGHSGRSKLAGLPGVSPGGVRGVGGLYGVPVKVSRLGQTTYADSDSAYSRASLDSDAVQSVRLDDGVGESMTVHGNPHLAALRAGAAGQGASAPLPRPQPSAGPGLLSSSVPMAAAAVLTAAAPAPIRTSASRALRQYDAGAGGADTPPAAKKGFLVAPEEELGEAAGCDGGAAGLGGAVAPIPPADWNDFMPARELLGPDGAPAPPVSGVRWLRLMAMFRADARAQQQALWRARLRAALETGDATELAAWVDFHNGRGGGRDQAELDAVLWLALEAGSSSSRRSRSGDGGGGGGGGARKGGSWNGAVASDGPAPSLVRVLLRGGATADAPRPSGQVVAASSSSGSGTSTPHSVRSVRNKVSPAGGGGAAAALVGATPLMRAAELGSTALVEVLLDGGAAPDAAQPGSGLTALHRAILASPPEAAWTAAAAGGTILASSASGRPSSMNGAGVGVGVGVGGAGAGPPKHPALRCAAMLVEKLGLDKARRLRCGGDDLVRFAMRHGRGDAVRWLLAAGLTPAVPSEEEGDDQASCAYLAGQLAVTLDVWDLPPPPPAAAPPLRDPLRPAADPAWVLSAEEKRFAACRRQLLCGAAAAGRLDVIARLLDKRPPYDRLRRDELEAALAAARRGSGGGAAASPSVGAVASQRQVEELLSKRTHTGLHWDRELVPALQRFDLEVVSQWLLRDFPSPAALDRALAATLTAERLSLPVWQDAAVATVRALIAGGADVNCVWEMAAPVAAATAATVAHLGDMSSREGGGGQAVLTPLLAALQAPAPQVVSLLLAAGANPRRRDAPGGENALAFAVRMAERAQRSAAAGAVVGGDDHLGHLLGGGRYAAHAAGSAEAAAAVTAAAAVIATLLDTEFAPELLTARNEHGQSPVFMAAVLNLPATLKALVEASSAADPWAKAAAAPPPPGVSSTDTPLELLPLPAGSSGAASSAASRPAAAVLVAPPGQWGAVHEAARCGALGTLSLLLGRTGGANGGPLLPPGVAAPPPEVAAARLRDAFVGAVRGGRVGAAKQLLDLQGRGLYERELAAALALAKASAAAPAALPPGLASGGSAAAADPARYDVLIAFLSSRAHVYMDWAGEVLPALRDGNMATIQRWIQADHITADDASRALEALVEAAQACKESAAVDTSAAASTWKNGGVGKRRRRENGQLASLGLGGGGAGAGADELGGGSSILLLSKGPTARAVAEIAAELVRAGADVNATVAAVEAVTGAPAGGGGAGGRQTLLMAAAVRGSLPLVEVLLAVGARVDAEDGAGCTAVDLAILARQRLGGSDGPGKRVLAALLAAYGERRLNTHRTAAGDSALMLAARIRNRDIVGQLLEAGATPAAADASEPTPASEAAGRSSNTGGGGVEDGMVQLGALHGGRITLLEASLGVPDILKVVPGPSPPEGGGSAALGAVAKVCARLAEQAEVRLEEAQVLLRELAAANLAAASGDTAAALAPADAARVAKYLKAKTKVLEEVCGCHEHMRLFYAAARTSLHLLETGLRQRRDDMAAKLSGSSAAQMRLVGLQAKLAASKDEMTMAITAKRDATLKKVESLLEARLRGLEAATVRGEAGVQQQMETAIMEIRRTVARRLKEIEDKKVEGYNRLTNMERRVDVMYTRKQRALATKPPDACTALDTAAASVKQELQALRANLAERVDQAIRKMEGAQRRAGAAALNMEGVRQELEGLAKRQAQQARAAADNALKAVAARAEELQAADKHDDLLRTVGGMAVEVSRGSAASASACNSVLTALSAAFSGAEESLAKRVEEGRARMQAFLSNSVTTHVAYVSGLMAQQQAKSESGAAAAVAADEPAMPSPPDEPPAVEALLAGLDVAHALDGIELTIGSGGSAGKPEPPTQLPNLEAAEEMHADMIGGMRKQVLLAFPDDGIVDSLPQSEAALLLDTDADLDTSGLGLAGLRETLAGLDLELPDLEVNPESVDLSVLKEEAVLGSVPGAMPPPAILPPYGMMPPPGVPGAPGAMPFPPPYGMMPFSGMPGAPSVVAFVPPHGILPPGFGLFGFYDPYVAGRAYQEYQRQRQEEEEHEEEVKREGQFHAAGYRDKAVDDFKLSYS